MTSAILVLTTTATQADARRIARELLNQKLAACVQINGPTESLYWWKGNLETATEWQCVIKTHSDLYPQLEQAIRASHPYETPEILAIPVVQGSEPYLRWLSGEVSS